jgi:arsenate reductase (glutaredoxin)
MQARFEWELSPTPRFGRLCTGMTLCRNCGIIQGMKNQPIPQPIPQPIFQSIAKQVVLYGIPNCDTVKKARAWLAEQGVDYQFHDFRKQGVPEPELDGWLQAAGWQKLVNRRGPTWRKLDAEIQAGVVDAASAKRVILLNSSVVKRPVVRWAHGQITVGFDAAVWQLRAS